MVLGASVDWSLIREIHFAITDSESPSLKTPKGTITEAPSLPQLASRKEQ
jgi:hypothetical protein